jgi:hypothetical protein
VNRIKRPNTWLHRPMLQNVKKALANTEPSTHGTFRTWRNVRSESVMRTKADVRQRLWFHRFTPWSGMRSGCDLFLTPAPDAAQQE